MPFESQTQPDQKLTHWNRIEQDVERITDKLGRAIDPEIKPLVVALKANRFGTTQSCEGHIDEEGLAYPWVQVESPMAEALLNDPHFNELKAKARSMMRGGPPIATEEQTEYERVTDAKIRANKETHERLARLLEDFYASQPALPQPSLVIKEGPWHQSRLMPANAEDNSHAHQSYQTKRANLDSYRREMMRFTDFLKSRYFNTPS